MLIEMSNVFCPITRGNLTENTLYRVVYLHAKIKTKKKTKERQYVNR